MLDVASFSLLFAAAMTAGKFARRRGSYGPVADFLTTILMLNGIRLQLPGSAYPVALFLYLADAAVAAAAALVVFDGHRAAWLAVPGWVAAGAWLCVRPPADDEAQRRVYLVVALWGLLLGFGALARWVVRVRDDFLRGGRRLALRDVPEQLAMALVLANQLASALVGAFRYGLWEHWELALWCQVVLYASLSGLQATTLARDRCRT